MGKLFDGKLVFTQISGSGEFECVMTEKELA